MITDTMDRNREARRAAVVTTNGLSRRRHRTSSLRDSPEDDGPVELQETARLRDRTSKKDRDRDRERDRDRDRSGRIKRRRGDKFIHGSNREDGGDDSSEESVNDEDEEDPDDVPVRYIPPNTVSMSSSASSLTNHRKNFPPPVKIFRAAPTPTWKAADEMIGVSVPRKARSASAKRSHDCWSSGSGVGEQIHLQAASSPVRPSMKPNGPRQRPPKTSSIQDDIEIEVAEVLYGLLRQSQGQSKQEMLSNDSAKLDSREMNRSSSDSKSRVSSPIANSPFVPPQHSSVLLQNFSSPAPPLSVVAPKRKRPRPVYYQEDNPLVFGARSSLVSQLPKVEADELPKQDGLPPNCEKSSVSAVENGGVFYDLMNSQAMPAASGAQLGSGKPEQVCIQTDAKPLVVESRTRDGMTVKVEEAESPTQLKELAGDRVDSSITKVSSSIVEKGNHREEKFQIDLMASPSKLRLSPERGGETEYGGAEDGQRSIVADEKAGTNLKPVEDEELLEVSCGGDGELKGEAEEEKAKPVIGEDADPEKLNLHEDRNIDLQLDLEKVVDKGETTLTVDDRKLNHQLLKQQPPKTSRDDANKDKNAQSSSLQLQMPVAAAGWPVGIPPMGYVAPLQGVVSMDGSTMAPPAIPPPHFLFSQPRPKRCVSHCHIARNIQCHQQFMKMNAFWPAAAASPPLFGAKPYNLNVVPSADLHGNVAGRSINPVQDKGQALTFFPGQSAVKDKVGQVANIADGAPKKQFLLQQSLPPGVPSNALHGPAFIFPLGQQHAAASASARHSSIKSASAIGSAASISASNSAPMTSSSTAALVTPTMSFNFPNMPANETQYLAILGNSPYPFPIPAHVGGAPPYGGSHAQAMPFFNGSFYSSQMLHPSQLQQQQPPPSQSLQLQQGQNNGISTASSSQKHLHNQQQRPLGSGANEGSSNPNLQTFPAPKNRASGTTHREAGSADSPSTIDTRVSWPNMSVYGQNFSLPIHPSNFAMLTPTATLGGATTASGNSNGNHGEKQQPQTPPPPPQQQAMKSGIESLTTPAFAMSFASVNAATTGLDISTMVQNHAILQSFPEAARNNYQLMAAAAAAQAAQQKKSYRLTEDGKAGAGDSSNVDDERKAMAARASASVGQPIAFARPDLTETSASALTGNNVVDSSARSFNNAPVPVHTSRSSTTNAVGSVNGSNSQQQQMIQLQKQQFAAAAVAAARSKTPSISNGSIYVDHLSSSSAVASKFQTPLPGFAPSLVQNSNSPAQSPQWKNTSRPAMSQVSSPSIATSTSSAMKNLPQQQSSRPQQVHSQISFGTNPKSSQVSQGQVPSSHQAPSPPMMVGSPSSSISKSAGGSPRTAASTSTANKAAQASTLPMSQLGKNSPSVASQKSSPVGGRNAPSILSSPHITTSSTGAKQSQQLQSQVQQPQLSKQSIQQAQLFFSKAYMQAQAPNSAASGSGYYLQRHRSEQPQPMQKSHVAASTSSSGMLSNTPVSFSSSSTSDPAKAVAGAAAAAAAASSMKGGLPPSSQGILHVAQFSGQSSASLHQLVPAGFPYKPTEQKQPAGNGGLLPRK